MFAAVVRDGHLAPYQELSWLTAPLESERAWLAEHDTRFKELITALHDDVEGPYSFPGWVITRVRERRRSADDETQVAWEDFQKARPALARAGVRFLGSAGLPLPDGAPRGEAYRRPPDLDDWLVLLEDYALRCLRASSEDGAAGRYEAVAAALGELGFRLTRQGIRRGTSEVDRLLTGSQAKALGLVEVLAAEMESRGDALRAVVLCDSELAEAKPAALLEGVLDFSRTRATSKMDRAMTMLALLSAVALPVSLIADLYGMNMLALQQIPLNVIAMMVGAMVLFTLGMFRLAMR